MAASKKPAPRPRAHPLQDAVDAAVAAEDVPALHAAQASLRPVAPDPERRCVAYGFLRLAERAAAEQRFADAHALVRAAGVARGRPDVVVSVLAGNTAMHEARRLDGEHRDRLLDQAAKCFETAHHIHPRHVAALLNWANALAAAARSRAAAATRARADRMWTLAGEKYGAVSALAPERSDAWEQWGHAFAERARWSRDDAASGFLDEACVRYAEALRLDPKRGTALLAWANVLQRLARTRAGAECAALLDGACEKFKAAAKLVPGRADLLRHWGLALVARASLAVGEDTPTDADRLRVQAVAKFDEAAALRPDDPSLPLLSATTQLDRAAARRGTKPEPPAKCIELAAAAREALVRVARTKGSSAAALLALARAEALRGETAKCAAALQRWAAAAAEKPSRKDVDACRDFDALREDERFVAFRKGLGRRG